MSNSIDVAGLVSQLMGVERAPMDLLTARQATFKKRADALDSLKTLVSDIATKAAAFDIPAEWNVLKAASSNAAVTATATTGEISGSLTFTVGELATTQKLYSSATLASTTTPVTTASRLLLAAGGAPLGLAQLTGSTDLSLGTHTVEVTQASTAAVKTGPWPTSQVSIDVDTNTVVLELNGTEFTVTLADAADADHQAVVDNLNTAFAASGIGGQVAASITSTGQLQLQTTGEGSAHTLKVTGGSALPALGLSVDATAIAGSDAKVKVDGVETTLTDIQAGGTASLSAGVDKGSVDVTFAGGLRTGTLGSRNVDLGDGSLSAVVNAINGSGGDVAASAIKVGDGAYRLQIQSKTSGVAGRMNFDQAVFDGIGSFATLTAGTDASIQLTGENPLTITSSSNTFTDVLPGVSFTLNTKPAESVTVTASRDEESLTNRVQGLVDAINKAVTDIKTKTSWDATAKTGGTLVGNYSLTRLQQTLRSAVTDAVTGGSLDMTQAGQAGITLAKNGTLVFDKIKFLEAYTADPAGVQRLFVSEANDPEPGITARLATLVKTATNFTSGTLSTAVTSQRNIFTDLGKQIERFDNRMLIRERTLMTQFSNLNSALSSLGNQSQWLAGQISGFS